jgi:quercetin dioxygenase-like cupin family protein
MLVHLQVLAASAGLLPANTNMTAISVPTSTVCSPRIVASYVLAPQCYCWNDRATCEAIHNLVEVRGENPRTPEQGFAGRTFSDTVSLSQEPIRDTLLRIVEGKEFRMKTAHIIAVAMLIAGMGLVLQPTRAQQPGTKRIDLQRHDLSTPGREAIQARVEFDPGAEFGKHSHPGEEIIYVLEGSLEYQIEGKPPVTLKAGDVLFIPAGTIHSARNVGTGRAAELATYIVEKGKPLLTVVQ